MKREEILKIILRNYCEAGNTQHYYKANSVVDDILSLSPTDINVGSKGEEKPHDCTHGFVQRVENREDNPLPWSTKAIDYVEAWGKESSLTAEDVLVKHCMRMLEQPNNHFISIEEMKTLPEWKMTLEAMEEYFELRKVEMPQPEIKPETAQQYYDRLRRQGWTDDISSHPDPDYKEPFYQNIFRLMEGFSLLKSKPVEMPSDWISVDDRLPEAFKWVLCYGSKGTIVISSVDKENVIDTFAFTDFEEVPTHWMPLPNQKPQ